MSLSGNAAATKVLRGKVMFPDTIHGKSAYELAVIHGFGGTEEEWLESLQGKATPEFIAIAEQTQQAYSDFLKQLGTDVATLVGGKIPMSQIPATATQEIYIVASEDELVSLVAQKGDLAELIKEIDGERTITKTWQLVGSDSTVRENWVVWGTSYAVSAGNAATATSAGNANRINNHRLIEMSAEDFASAVKEADTYYLVY